MHEGKKPAQPPASPDAVSPRHVDGQSEFHTQNRILIEFCQGPGRSPALPAAPAGGGPTDPPNRPPSARLSRDEVDQTYHALLGDMIRFLSLRGIDTPIANQILEVVRRLVLKAAASRPGIVSVEAAVEILAEELLGRVAGLSTFPSVLELIARDLSRFAKRFLDAGSDAEDCLQEALLRVHNSPGKFAAFSNEQALGVVRGVAKNVQREQRRSQPRVILAEGEELRELDPFQGHLPYDVVEVQQVAELLRKEKCRELRIVVEDQDDKAEKKKRSRTAIERASRARGAIAKFLDAHGIDTRLVYRRRPRPTSARRSRTSK